MLTTAKSIQLLDANGMNISPITDITSLYYEVQHSQNDNIITRKYVYDGFPVFVNISNEEIPQIGVANVSQERHPSDGPLYDNGMFYKLINKTSGNDILISNVSTDIVPGTTLRQINITNYNLSKILSYYTPLDLMDASINALDVSVNNINSSIRDISTKIHGLDISLDASTCSFSDILYWRDNGYLIPNKFYLIIDYFEYNSGKEGGCMWLPNDSGFSGPTAGNSLSLLIKANDSRNLDGKLYEMYDQSGNALKVIGTYKIERNSSDIDLIHITYMKDQYRNEAPYDFYNLKYNDKFTFNTSVNSNYLLITNTIKNNIIKSNPYDNNNQIILNCSTNNISIENNYIGTNTIININHTPSDDKRIFKIVNNIIYNDCNIYAQLTGSDILNFKNNIINNNNVLTLNSGTFNSNIIKNNNIINKKCIKIEKSVINSSNNITLYNNASNAIILNNCNASINLSDNIIVDNYIDTATNSSLNTSSNSVYLFKQDIYAKSFITLK